MISATAMRVTSVRSPNWDQPIRRHHPLEKSGWLEVGRRDDLYIFFHLKIKPRVTLFRGRSIVPFFGPARQVVGSDSGTDACFFFQLTKVWGKSFLISQIPYFWFQSRDLFDFWICLYMFFFKEFLWCVVFFVKKGIWNVKIIWDSQGGG